MKKIRNLAILSVLIGVLLTSNVLVFRLMVGDSRIGYCADESSISAYAAGETINFTNREEEYIETQNGVPTYYSPSDLANACGPVAGAIVVGFYDKYYNDLIEGYTSSFASSGKYRPSDSVYVPALMRELYTLMRTNVDDVGVSESDCLAGLKAYVQSKGYSFNYSSVASSTKISESNYKNAVISNKPVLIFSKQAEVYSFTTNSATESVNSVTVNGNHVFVGYGYMNIKYYNGANNFRTDTYIAVACGLSSLKSGYLKISSTADSSAGNWFVNGYAADIA